MGQSHANGTSTYNGPDGSAPMMAGARPASSVTAIGTLEPPPHWWHRV